MITKKQFFEDLLSHITAVSNVTHRNGGFLAFYAVPFNFTLFGLPCQSWSNDSAEDAVRRLAKSIYLSTFLSGQMFRILYPSFKNETS